MAGANTHREAHGDIGDCANAALWPTIVSGATDGLYSLLVLIAWIYPRSPVDLGIGIRSGLRGTQQAWFFLLFYAI